MTTQQIDDRILELKKEQLQLTANHDARVAELQQLIQNDRNRYQQLIGSILELQHIKENGKDKP